jgi:hypothetical protein
MQAWCQRNETGSISVKDAVSANYEAFPICGAGDHARYGGAYRALLVVFGHRNIGLDGE